MQQTALRIVDYQPQYATYFNTLNKAWLEEYFVVEPIDQYVLENPEEAILTPGGKILFAEQEGRIIGTVALKYLSPGIYELTKMAVDKEMRGLGAGKQLCKAAIDAAKDLGAEKLILYSQTGLSNAIGIYRKMGFTELPLEKGGYERADIKMGLLLTNSAEKQTNVHTIANTGKWFDRKFDFHFGTDQFSILAKRLRDAPESYERATTAIQDRLLNEKPGGKWSVKEHIGHLFIMEPLWLKRLHEIKEGKPEMAVADLNNTATDAAGFNQLSVSGVLDEFRQARLKTMHFIDQLQPDDLTNTSLHPRLKEPMRIVDLMYFVAEHDDHHLFTVQTLLKNNKR